MSPLDFDLLIHVELLYEMIFFARRVIYVWSSHIARVNKGQPGKVANPARGQLNRENEYFPVPVRA